MLGDNHFDYDAFGNLVRERRGAAQRLVTEYAYDVQRRMVSATLPNGLVAEYRYDAFGRRIQKTYDGKVPLMASKTASGYRAYESRFMPISQNQVIFRSRSDCGTLKTQNQPFLSHP
jgi:YD repeat-containing protein